MDNDDAGAKELVMVVEDNPDILFNIKMTLEFNDFDVMLAKNGREAIEVLGKSEQKPHIIVSDILMPDMDGYEFFKQLSEDPDYNTIPFIFLTALANPEDVRLGKLLGSDDYITKPFKDEDLLTSIRGVLNRSKKYERVKDEVEVGFHPNGSSTLVADEEQSNVFLFVWDEQYGPVLKGVYPETLAKQQIQHLGVQLFQATVSIFGHYNQIEPEGVLLPVSNLKKQAYLFFDSFPDADIRGGACQFMVATIAPKISYYQSLQIKKLFKEFSLRLKSKNGPEPSVRELWDDFRSVFTEDL